MPPHEPGPGEGTRLRGRYAPFQIGNDDDPGDSDSDSEPDDDVAAENPASPTLPSTIILRTIVAIACAQQLTGWSLPLPLSARSNRSTNPGYPVRGDWLKDGAQNFTKVKTLLQQAVPVTWQGDAAEKYATANATLMTLAQQMNHDDLRLEGIIKDHAGKIGATQFLLGRVQDALFATYFLLRYIQMDPLSMPMAYRIANGASKAALVAATSLLYGCFADSASSTETAERLAYARVTETARHVTAAYQPAKARLMAESAENSTPTPAVLTGVPTPGVHPEASSGAPPRRTSHPSPTSGGQSFKLCLAPITTPSSTQKAFAPPGRAVPIREAPVSPNEQTGSCSERGGPRNQRTAPAGDAGAQRKWERAEARRVADRP